MILTSVSSDMYANKLHIHMKKSCFMHFKPKGSSFTKENNNQPEVPPVKICVFEIKAVTTTKFLTIDNKLSWVPQITTLAKKLRCCSGQLNHIKNTCLSFYIKVCIIHYLNVTYAMVLLYGLVFQLSN